MALQKKKKKKFQEEKKERIDSKPFVLNIKACQLE